MRISDINGGNSIGSDKGVLAPGNSFASTDTLYASVVTTGSSASPAAPATVAARWLYNGSQVVDSTSQTITPSGAANGHA